MKTIAITAAVLGVMLSTNTFADTSVNESDVSLDTVVSSELTLSQRLNQIIQSNEQAHNLQTLIKNHPGLVTLVKSDEGAEYIYETFLEGIRAYGNWEEMGEKDAAIIKNFEEDFSRISRSEGVIVEVHEVFESVSRVLIEDGTLTEENALQFVQPIFAAIYGDELASVVIAMGIHQSLFYVSNDEESVVAMKSLVKTALEIQSGNVVTEEDFKLIKAEAFLNKAWQLQLDLSRFYLGEIQLTDLEYIYDSVSLADFVNGIAAMNKLLSEAKEKQAKAALEEALIR